MARKRNSNSGFYLLLLFIVAILIALATPVVVAYGFIFNMLKVSKIRQRLRGNMSDFWLHNHAKNLFKEKISKLAEVNQIIKKAIQQGNDAGISKNMDGSFSARSNLGKEIRAILDKYAPIKDKLTAELFDLQTFPQRRWEIFNEYVCRMKAWSTAFFVWLLTLAYFYFYLDRESMIDIFRPYLALATNIFREQQAKIPLIEGDIEMIAAATLLTIFSYFASKFIFKNSASGYTLYPDRVTLENIDKY